MKNIVADILKKIQLVLSEAFSSFRRNNGLSAASSLAFSATIALIPSLFLLTFLLGAAIGSSERALAKTQEFLMQLIPAYSQVILREVRNISAHVGAIGLLNGLVLFWSVTPLVADMRVFLGIAFRRKPGRAFLVEKLFDVAISIVLLLGISAITVAGILLTLADTNSRLHQSLAYFEGIAPFLFVLAVVFALYTLFAKRMSWLHLLTGAVAASLLWFALRPVFHLFLLYNPGYGFAFGSFKSLFVVIIWIYFSFVVFLFGAEIAASLGRDETFFIKKLMEGKKNIPRGVIDKYVVNYAGGSIIFSEGDPGDEMFSVLRGRVAILKGGKEIAVITPGKWFGGMSFFLSSPRMARAAALEDVELVVISNENINNLMNEYPEFVVGMLREMAQRLREANRMTE
jgi:YihY family inner membrane protein